MKVLLFSDPEIWEILTLLAALLHTGNINYKAAIIDNLDATEIPDHSNVARVAGLLGVPKQPLIDALTRKTLFAHGETVVSVIIKCRNDKYYFLFITVSRLADMCTILITPSVYLNDFKNN